MVRSASVVVEARLVVLGATVVVVMFGSVVLVVVVVTGGVDPDGGRVPSTHSSTFSGKSQ